jgi:hypothetical protein
LSSGCQRGFLQKGNNMPLYFLLLDAAAFHTAIKPALVASWRQRSFAPCRELCRQLQVNVQAFTQRYHLGSELPLLAAAADGALTFDRVLWQHLAGEMLWFGAADIPEIITSPEVLTVLLADERARQTLYGSQDLLFGGGYYRPDHAGWNDTAAVAQLADYLAGVRPGTWTADVLIGLPQFVDDRERAEELEFVRDWFASLVELYGQAAQRRQIVVCETL